MDLLIVNFIRLFTKKPILLVIKSCQLMDWIRFSSWLFPWMLLWKWIYFVLGILTISPNIIDFQYVYFSFRLLSFDWSGRPRSRITFTSWTIVIENHLVSITVFFVQVLSLSLLFIIITTLALHTYLGPNIRFYQMLLFIILILLTILRFTIIMNSSRQWLL